MSLFGKDSRVFASFVFVYILNVLVITPNVFRQKMAENGVFMNGLAELYIFKIMLLFICLLFLSFISKFD